MRRIRSLRAFRLAVMLTCFSVPALTQTTDAPAPAVGGSPLAIEGGAKGERAVVLLNLRGSIDRKPVTKVGSPVANDVFSVYLANLDELSVPEQVEQYRLDKQAAAEGWHAWRLRPGLYFLLILPPGLGQNPPAAAYHAPSGRFGRFTRYQSKPGSGAFWSPELAMYVLDGPAPEDFEPLAGFTFEVPSAHRVDYLGSVSMMCKAGRGLFGSLIDSCSDFEFADDLAGAQQLALHAFAGLTVEAMHLMRYGEPAAGLRLADLAATSIVSEAPAGVATGIGGTGLDPWATVPGVGQGFMIYNLLAATFEMAENARERRQAEQDAARLAPCMQRLAASIDQSAYHAVLVESLEQAAAARGTPMKLSGEGEPRAEDGVYLLSARAPIIRLVASGGNGRMALDLVVDLRLYNQADRTLHYASLLWYGSGLQPRSPFVGRSPLYLRSVETRSPERDVAEWCGEGGPSLIAKDIAGGLREIAEQFVRDIDR